MRGKAANHRQSADVIAHQFGDCVMQDLIGLTALVGGMNLARRLLER
jgi:hypothetical protein